MIQIISKINATESETTTIFTSVTTKGKAQGMLLFEGGMFKSGPKVVVSSLVNSWQLLPERQSTGM